MVIYAETSHLILREILPEDAEGLYELDSSPLVHRYLGNQPVVSLEQSREIIRFIRQQYTENGIGRWAVIEKSSGQFAGWAGLKLVKETINNHTHFYDVGYRLITRFWGKGYATEAAVVSIRYGFEQLQQPILYGMADAQNEASKKVLQKAGMQYVNSFELEGSLRDWFEIKKPAV